MFHYVIKIALTTGLVVAVSEIARRSSLIGAVLASIPLVSVLAMIWLYADTHDAGKVARLAKNIFWLVLPSLALFVLLPVLLERGYNFYASLAASILATVLCYYLMIVVLRPLGAML